MTPSILAHVIEARLAFDDIHETIRRRIADGGEMTAICYLSPLSAIAIADAFASTAPLPGGHELRIVRESWALGIEKVTVRIVEPEVKS